MRRAVQIIAAAVFLAGAAVFLGPYVNRWMADQDASDVIETFEVETAVGREDAGDRGEDVDASAGGADLQSEDYAAGVSAEALAALREELSAYNREIYENGQAGLKDPFSYETPGFDLTEYGFSQNVIGVLWIPRIEENLPIYLGADHDNMAKGAALLGETSMPLGETDSNTVIAAHRGWKGIPMLRNIQQLQIGDKIQITTPWDVLIYRVCDLKIISPDDSQEIFIQEGRGLVTLLTCHPYPHNYQRYLVFAERSAEEPQTMEEDLEEVGKTWDPSPREVEDISGEEPATVQIDPAALSVSLTDGMAESGAGYSNLQIWLETYGVWILLAVVLIVVVSAVILTGRRKSGAVKGSDIGMTDQGKEHRKNRRRRRRRKR